MKTLNGNTQRPDTLITENNMSLTELVWHYTKLTGSSIFQNKYISELNKPFSQELIQQRVVRAELPLHPFSRVFGVFQIYN